MTQSRYAIDPELAADLAGLPHHDFRNISATRAFFARMLAEAPEPAAPGVEVTEVSVPGPEGAPDVVLRIYRPRDATSAMPAVFTIHGGGFVLGSVAMAHRQDLGLCRALGAIVVAVDYRLAPESPYPAGLEDCLAGLNWVAAHADELGIDAKRVALRGTSAGACLAAGLALLVRDRGGPRVCFQFLASPALDDRLQTDSMRQFTDTPNWRSPDAEACWDAYLGADLRGSDAVTMYAAPARATELTRLPPAYISVMEFDPLRDEGIAYALALLSAGVRVELHLFPGTYHGSVDNPSAAISQRESAEEVAVLRAALRC